MKDAKGNELDPQAVERDKQLWFTAWKKLRNESRPAVNAWLSRLPENDREDMRRRLNTIHANKRRGYNYGGR